MERLRDGGMDRAHHFARRVLQKEQMANNIQISMQRLARGEAQADRQEVQKENKKFMHIKKTDRRQTTERRSSEQETQG